jgi:uncharacterized protein
VDLAIAGEQVELLPQRALYWARALTLFVADLHLGKAATFGAAGIPVPGETGHADLAALAACIAQTRAQRLVILGDLLHARNGRDAATLDSLARWRAAHPALDIVLVRGNHDHSAGDPPRELGIRAVDDPHHAAPFVLAHRPEASKLGYVLAGHIHPAITLHGPASLRERLPCFVIGRSRAILPAFGSFTGSARFPAAAGDRVVVIAGDQLIEPTSRARSCA